MEVEEKKIKTGKPYEELTKEEKALIVDFTEEEHAGMKLKYGKRLKHYRGCVVFRHMLETFEIQFNRIQNGDGGCV